MALIINLVCQKCPVDIKLCMMILEEVISSLEIVAILLSLPESHYVSFKHNDFKDFDFIKSYAIIVKITLFL